MTEITEYDVQISAIGGPRPLLVYSRSWPAALALSIKAGEELAFSVRDEPTEGDYVIAVSSVRKSVDGVDDWQEVKLTGLLVTGRVISFTGPRPYPY